MKDLPISSAAVVWTDKGLKIVRTDACGDMVDMRTAPAVRRLSKKLPESLSRLLTVVPSQVPPAPEGPGVNPTA